MKIYIAGKITGREDSYKTYFDKAEEKLKQEGHVVMKPSVLPFGFAHHEYLKINFAMIDACEGVYFMKCWKDSRGAIMEHEYAIKEGKSIFYE